MNKKELLSFKPTQAETLYNYELPYQVPLIVGDVVRILKPGVSVADFDREFFMLVATSFNRDVRYINSVQLADPTNYIVSQMLVRLDPRDTLVVLPGEGSKAVLGDNLTGTAFDQYERVFIPTSRTVENGKVIGVSVNIPGEISERLRCGNLRSIFIIDDVVATGKTLTALREAIQEISDKPLNFSAFAWFCREPCSITADYQTVRGVYTYWTGEGYPALNTVSTWLKGDEKSRVVLEGIERKYVLYPYGFKKQLAVLRNMTVL